MEDADKVVMAEGMSDTAGDEPAAPGASDAATHGVIRVRLNGSSEQGTVARRAGLLQHRLGPG